MRHLETKNKDMIEDKHIYTFSNLASLPGLIHGTSDKTFGSIKDLDGEFHPHNLKKFTSALNIVTAEVVLAGQTHSSNIAYALDTKNKFIENVDGLITDKPNLFLGIVTADCLPVILYDEKKKLAGILHAGYKGLLGHIIELMLKQFKTRGSQMENIKIGIGPSIGVCCYEVDFERISDFKQEFTDLKFNNEAINGKYRLDLKNVAHEICAGYGILEKNIEVSEICTMCSRDRFYSYRGNGKKSTGEFITIVGMR